MKNAAAGLLSERSGFFLSRRRQLHHPLVGTEEYGIKVGDKPETLAVAVFLRCKTGKLSPIPLSPSFVAHTYKKTHVCALLFFSFFSPLSLLGDKGDKRDRERRKPSNGAAFETIPMLHPGYPLCGSPSGCPPSKAHTHRAEIPFHRISRHPRQHPGRTMREPWRALTFTDQHHTPEHDHQAHRSTLEIPQPIPQITPCSSSGC